MRHLRDFAESVGLRVRKVKVGSDRLYSDTFVELLDSRGERLCLETTIVGVAEAIEVYAGGHENFAWAKAQFESTIGQKERT